MIIFLEPGEEEWVCISSIINKITISNYYNYTPFNKLYLPVSFSVCFWNVSGKYVVSLATDFYLIKQFFWHFLIIAIIIYFVRHYIKVGRVGTTYDSYHKYVDTFQINSFLINWSLINFVISSTIRNFRFLESNTQKSA